MAYGGGARPRNPLFIVSAIGLFLFGLLVLLSSLNRALQVRRQSAAQRQVAESAPHGELIPEAVQYIPTQWVVVTTVPLRAGDQFFEESIEQRSAQWVVTNYPELQTEESKQDPKQPLVRGFYTNVRDVVDRYAACDLPAQTPLALAQVVDVSPLANPLDRIRTDRFVVAMPEEPTIYPLLRPGDRVDVYFIVHDRSIRPPISDVRVVAVNNIVTQQSGLVSAQEERQASRKFQEAALRKKRRLERETGHVGGQQATDQQGEPPPEEQTPPEEETTDQQPPGQETEPGAEGTDTTAAAGEEEEEELPEGTFRAGRKFDGRTITLQVTSQEAMLLALTHRTPGVTLAFALRGRNR